MRLRLVTLVLAVSLTLPVLAVAPPVAAQSLWCSLAIIYYSPTRGEAGSQITMTYTFDNYNSDLLDLYEFDVSYSWSSGSTNLGGTVIPGYGSWDFTQAVTLPTGAGSGSIYISVYGKASSDTVGDTCLFGPAPFSVTPGPAVTAVASATLGDAPMTVTFNAAASGGTSPYTYAWTFGDGATGSGTPVTHTYTQAGSYPAEVTATDGVGSQGTYSVIVTVNSPPSVTASANRTAAAPGVPLAFSASASGGSGGYTYAWTFGDGASASGVTASHAYSSPGNFTATVTVTDSVGGHGSANRTVTIALLVVTALESAASARPGTNVTFTTSATGGAGAPYTIIWDFGDGSTSAGLTVAHAYENPGTYTPTVTVRDATGATNTTTLAPITVASPSPLESFGAVAYAGIAAVVIAAGVTVAILLLRRRGRKKSEPQTPGPPTPPPPG